MLQQTFDIEDELCVYFIHWQKAFNPVNWTTLMEILKETCIKWHDSRLISKLYMDHSVKLKLDQGETINVKTGRGARQGCCLPLILFNLYSKYLIKETLEGFGDFKIGGQVIHSVKYADELVLLAEEETV
jgi:hypothetical protein